MMVIVVVLLKVQHLAGRRDQAERERGHGLRVPLEDVRCHASLLRKNIRGKRQEQLCSHLRAARR